MTKIYLTVTGASASAEKVGPLTTGMVGVPVECAFSQEWENLNRLMVFRAGEIKKDNTLQEGKSFVPAEVLTQPGQMLYIGVEGRSKDGTVVIPTVWAEAGKILSGACASGDPALAPTPSQFERFMAEVEQVDEKIEESLSRAKENGEFTGPQGEKGDKGEKGDVGPQGERGSTIHLYYVETFKTSPPVIGAEYGYIGTKFSSPVEEIALGDFFISANGHFSQVTLILNGTDIIGKYLFDTKGVKGDPGAVQTVNGVSPDTSGNVQIEAGGADWNATEGEPGYVRNRTHYAQMKELLPLTEVVGEDGELPIVPIIEGVVIGETYTVNYNGKDYACVGVDVSVVTPGAVALGDVGALTGEPSGAYPFVVGFVPADTAAQMGAGGMVWDLSGANSATISITGEDIHRIDEKFLPGNIYTVVFDTEDGSGSIVADKTFSEVAAMVCNPNVLVRALMRVNMGGSVVAWSSFTSVRYIFGTSIEFTAHNTRLKYTSVKMMSDGTITHQDVEYYSA